MRRRGFTLLELMIAIALTALVLAMVGGILVSTMEADQKIRDTLQTEKAGYGCLSLIRRDLEACYSYALGATAFKGDRGSAAATADQVAFVTATEGDPDPKTGLRPKLQSVGYKLQADPTANGSGALQLLRYATPYTSTQNDPLAPGNYSLVASGIKSFKLSYLDPKDRQWHDDEWDQTDRVPLAVKVSIELMPPSQQQGSPSSSSFGVNPSWTYASAVSLPTYFSPLPDQQLAPGQQPPGSPPQPPGTPPPIPPR